MLRNILGENQDAGPRLRRFPSREKNYTSQGPLRQSPLPLSTARRYRVGSRILRRGLCGAAVAVMPMKGRFPIRRTLQYLSQGDVVFKDCVKIMTVNYNLHGELNEGARKFVFFNIPQIQYKNPWLQIVMFKDMTPSPFLRFYLDTGEQVLVDIEEKTNREISEHIKKILGKSEETIRIDEEKKRKWHPATFGCKKYHLRECMCEIDGQIPCPGKVPLPKEMTGKYKNAMKDTS